MYYSVDYMQEMYGKSLDKHKQHDKSIFKSTSTAGA